MMRDIETANEEKKLLF